MTIHIRGVDGSSISLTSPDVADLLVFLEEHDHEGSSISVVVDDPDEVYQLLRRLAVDPA